MDILFLRAKPRTAGRKTFASRPHRVAFGKMDTEDRLQRAIRLSKLAADKDRDGDYPGALELYKLSLENWHFVCKYQTCPQMKESMYKKMEQYVERAENIKDFLQEQRKIRESNMLAARPTQAATDNSSSTASGSCSGETSEEERLREKLGSAIMTDRPKVQWSDIAGLDAAKEALQEAVILPTLFPTLFTGERKPWKGILLYGPPGTGKTYLGKACANEANATFVSVSSADLVSKWQGESEKLVRSLFDLARERKPSIIFIDEVDSMCCARSDSESESSRRIKTEFLIQMDGAGKDSNGVLVLGATNVPWELDSAIRRRFERRIYIPLPDFQSRRRLLELAIGETRHVLLPSDLDRLAQLSDGYSGADIAVMVRDALFQPVRRCRLATHFKEVFRDERAFLTPCSPSDTDLSRREMSLMAIPPEKLLPPDLSMNDFLIVMENARSTVGPEDLKKYVDWTMKYGLEGG